ncbi:MAG: carboxypeptidase regulatory-like domain-containing protein [bacterium]|nr:carboxypeptidase regulatory-like domain-containing protein [bacterium]
MKEPKVLLTVALAAVLLLGIVSWLAGPDVESGAPSRAPASAPAGPSGTAARAPLVRAPARAHEVGYVTFTDAGGEAIAGAELEFLELSTNAHGAVTTDDGGRARLPVPGRFLIRAHAPGFSPRPRIVSLSRGGACVLTATGGVEIAAPGLPTEVAESIELELLPPHEGGGVAPRERLAAPGRASQVPGGPRIARERWEELYAAYERAVDASFGAGAAHPELESSLAAFTGAYPYSVEIDPRALRASCAGDRAGFEHLPAGPGYRYFVRAPFPIAAVPTGEESAIVFRPDGRVLSRSRALPRALSGEFEIPAGGRLQLTLEVANPGSISGTLVDFDAEREGAIVALRHLEQHVHPHGGVGLTTADIDQELSPDGHGAFHFTAVRPGTKRILVRHQRPERRVAYLVRELELDPGQHIDLGALYAEGASITCTIGFVTEKGERRSARELFGESQSAGVGFSNTRVRPAWSMITDYVLTPFDEPFVFEGLQPGEYHIEASMERSVRAKLRPPYTLDRARKGKVVVEVVGEAASEVRIDLLVVEGNTQVFLFARPPRGVSLVGQPDVRLLSGGRGIDVRLEGRHGALPYGAVLVPPGTYLAVCRSREGFACVREVVIPSAPEHGVELDVLPAVTIAGRVVGSAGEPRTRDSIELAFGPDDPSAYTLVTGADGSFELAGVAAGVVLWARGADGTSAGPIRIPDEPGEVTLQEVRMR